MIEVLVHAITVPVDPTPGTTAGEIGAAVAAANGVNGDIFTLKANGVVLAPGDSIDGHSAPYELIEHVEPVAAPSPVVDADPAPTVLKVGRQTTRIPKAEPTPS